MGSYDQIPELTCFLSWKIRGDVLHFRNRDDFGRTNGFKIKNQSGLCQNEMMKLG